MFFYDIETLGVESTAVILSLGLVYAKPEYTIQQMFDNSLFVKFGITEQLEMGRTFDKDTVDWWNKQGDFQKKRSLHPSKDDVSVVEGLSALNDFAKLYVPDGNVTVWIRGSLDQLATDSLFSKVDLVPHLKYNRYRDIRTAIDILKESAKGNGYCDIPEEITKGYTLVKHEPVHDSVLDAAMLLHGV